MFSRSLVYLYLEESACNKNNLNSEVQITQNVFSDCRGYAIVPDLRYLIWMPPSSHRKQCSPISIIKVNNVGIRVIALSG